MVDKIAKAKMVYALHGMQAKQKNQLRKIITNVNSKLYSRLKEELSSVMSITRKGKPGLKGRTAWNKGKTLTDATKQKIRIARTKQDMSYRKGQFMSDEQKKKISKTLLGNIPWNKGKSNTGFGDPNNINPMKNPDSIRKMLETRAKNKLLDI